MWLEHWQYPDRRRARGHRGGESSQGVKRFRTRERGLIGSIVIYLRQAKQIPSADAFPRKQSPSSLSQSARPDECPGASAQLGSPGPTGRLDRRGGSGVVACGAELAGPGIAGCRRASTADKKLIRH